MGDNGTARPAATAWENRSRVLNQARELRDFAVQNRVPFNWRRWFRSGWEILRQDLYDSNGRYVVYSLVVGRDGKLRLYRMNLSGLRRVPLLYMGGDEFPNPAIDAIQKFISDHTAAA